MTIIRRTCITSWSEDFFSCEGKSTNGILRLLSESDISRSRFVCASILCTRNGSADNCFNESPLAHLDQPRMIEQRETIKRNTVEENLEIHRRDSKEHREYVHEFFQLPDWIVINPIQLQAWKKAIFILVYHIIDIIFRRTLHRSRKLTFMKQDV